MKIEEIQVGTRVFTKNEQSILIYLETCLVDGRGRVDGRRMNDTDLRIIRKWMVDGYIRFGRLPFKCIDALHKMGIIASHWVRLTDVAVRDAHTIRMERANRMAINNPVPECVLDEETLQKEGIPPWMENLK
jgi:hypothetical protein